MNPNLIALFRMPIRYPGLSPKHHQRETKTAVFIKMLQKMDDDVTDTDL